MAEELRDDQAVAKIYNALEISDSRETRQDALMQALTEMTEFEPESPDGIKRKTRSEFQGHFRRMLADLQQAQCEYTLLRCIMKYVWYYVIDSNQIRWLAAALEENVRRLRRTVQIDLGARELWPSEHADLSLPFDSDDCPIWGARELSASEHADLSLLFDSDNSPILGARGRSASEYAAPPLLYDSDDSPMLRPSKRSHSEHDRLEQFRLEEEAVNQEIALAAAMNEDDIAMRYAIHISMQDVLGESYHVQMDDPQNMSDMDMRGNNNGPRWST